MRRASAAGLARALLAAVAWSAAPAVSPAPATAQRGPDSVEIRSIGFQGNASFDEAQLRASIMADATHCKSPALLPLCWFGGSLQRAWFDPRVLAFDSVRVRLFYYRHGYREAQVALDTLRAADGVHVRFRVSEGRPVRVASIRLEGAEGFPPSLARGLPLGAGDPLDEIALEATRDSLRGRLQDVGYFHGDVLANYAIERGTPYQANVEYQLLPGVRTRFGEIQVQGASRVDPALILRTLAFRPGDLYSRTALLHSQRNLFALEVFRHAEIAPVGATDSVLPVRVLVIEGVQHRFRFGLGVTTAEYLNAEGRWLSRNLLGGARRLEATARIANLVAQPLETAPLFEDCSGIYCRISGSLHLDFAQPRFLDPLATLGAGLFLERVTVPQVYVRTSRGAYGSVRRSFGTGGTVALGYRPELTRLESNEQVFCANFTACESADIELLRESHRLAPLTFTFNLERANNLLSPTRGYALRLEGEVAGAATFSEFAYLRALGELVGYQEPWRGLVFASRARAGWARALGAPGEGLGLHPQRRFFAGGPSSVRGFAQYRLGPKLLTADAAAVLARPLAPDSLGAGCSPDAINAGTCDVTALARAHPERLKLQPVGGSALVEGNLELRFPLMFERFWGATFLDFGQVWRAGDKVQLGQLAWSPGVGVRYYSPIGPVRVDVGYNAAGAERLAVLSTDIACVMQNDTCVPLEPGTAYPYAQLRNGTQLRAQRSVVWNPYHSFKDRLQIHFSIGQAF